MSTGKRSAEWRLVLCASLFWIAAALIPSTDSSWDMSWQLLLLPTGVALMIGWTICARSASGFFAPGRIRLLQVFVVLTAVATVVVSQADFGLMVRLWLCEAEMESFSRKLLSGKEDIDFTSNGKVVGLFHVKGTFTDNDRVAIVTSRGFFGKTGIQICRNTDTAGRRRHLFGNWYTYSDDF